MSTYPRPRRQTYSDRAMPKAAPLYATMRRPAEGLRFCTTCRRDMPWKRRPGEVKRAGWKCPECRP